MIITNEDFRAIFEFSDNQSPLYLVYNYFLLLVLIEGINYITIFCKDMLNVVEE